MANAFKMLGDLISGLTALLMSLIGLGITAQVLESAGAEWMLLVQYRVYV